MGKRFVVIRNINGVNVRMTVFALNAAAAGRMADDAAAIRRKETAK